MDIKKILSLVLICICTVAFCACSAFSPLKENPNKNDLVTSNGGITVQKGEYLYYVNGFIAQSDIKDGDNSFGNVINGGIYRTKLNNGSLVLDDDEKISNSECVVPKIVGYENGGFYIFDNNIFYVSPNAEKSKDGTLQSEKVDFYMANINGSSTNRLYTSKSSYSSVSYGMKKYGDSVYLIILDGTSLYKFSIKNGSASGKVLLAENVTTALWSSQETYDANSTYNNEFDGYVYYTTSYVDAETQADNGNVLNKVSLTDGVVTTLVYDNKNTYTLKAIANDRIYYTVSELGDTTTLYSNTLNKPNFSDSQSSALRYNSYANYYVVNGSQKGYEGGILLSDSSNGTVFIDINGNVKTISSSTQYYLLYNQGSNIYLRSSDTMIYKVDLSSADIILTEMLSTDAKAKTSNEKYVDATNRYILYYGEYINDESTTKYYMHIVDTLSTDAQTLLPTDRLIAVLEEEDISKNEDD